MKKRTKKSRGGPATALNVMATLLLVAVILLCVPVTMPRMFGYQVYNVVTGSMEPSIRPAAWSMPGRWIRLRWRRTM